MELEVQKKDFPLRCLSMHTPDGCKKRHTLPLRRSDTTLLPQQEKEKIYFCPVTSQPMGDGHNSTNEKSLFFKIFNFFQ